jgi:hypothetical protein
LDTHLTILANLFFVNSTAELFVDDLKTITNT